MNLRTAFKLLCLIAILLRLALLFRGDELFYARPFIEDAYYSLSVAQSLGNGSGITVDGVHRTNGIQPLIVFLYAPFYFFFEDQLAARICLLLCIAIECALVFLCIEFIRAMSKDNNSSTKENTAWFAATILLWSYSTSVYTLNGLETALVVCTVLSCVLYYSKRFFSTARRSFSSSVVLGALLGLTMLARIDAGFLVVVFAVHHLRRQMNDSVRKRLLEACLFASTAFIVSSPWWIYNFFYFGHPIPTSGLSQRIVIPFAENVTAFVQYVLNTSLLLGYVPYHRSLTVEHFIIMIALASVLITVASTQSTRGIVRDVIQRLKENWSWRFPSMLLSYSILLMVYYTTNFGAPHFFARYLFVFHVLTVMSASLILTELVERFSTSKPLLVKIIGAGSFVGMICLYALTYSWNFSTAKAQQNDFLAIARWINEHTAPSERIGMGQSGTAGYFNKHVVNLDGKVNAEVFSANRKGKYLEYIGRQRFDYLIDWQKFFDDLKPTGTLDEFVKIDSVGRFMIYKRKAQ